MYPTILLNDIYHIKPLNGKNTRIWRNWKIIATEIPKLTSLFLFLPAQSYQTSVATKSSRLAFVKTFISRANERATSSRTAPSKNGNARAEFESVPLHTYNRL